MPSPALCWARALLEIKTGIARAGDPGFLIVSGLFTPRLVCPVAGQA